MSAVYDAQDRGSGAAYERYLAAMDASMRQKVALTAAHLLCRGRVADMGMGSGSGSHALAQLYPELEVVGVDIDPKMVELARERFTLPNLSFVAGDIAARVFEAGSLDGILDSSVLHHVTFHELGLRVLASTPLYNPWILRQRFEGKFELWSAGGEKLEPPATNYVIVGERVRAGEGVRFERSPAEPSGFLELTHFCRDDTGQVLDLVRRPNLTLDVVPWFAADGSVFVLARMSYPRPILGVGAEQPTLDGSRFVEWVSEPLSLLQTDKPIGLSVEEMLGADLGVKSAQIVSFREGTTYYPSPGGVAEEVRSVFVEVAPMLVATELGRRSGFSSSGRVRALEARQLLRAAQVGGLPDARLELNTYDLLLRLGIGVGPWIGEALDPHETSVPERIESVDACRSRPPRRRFQRVGSDRSKRFLELAAGEFRELDEQGNELARRTLEYVAPRSLGPCTIACTLVRNTARGLLLGLDDDDLPAAQLFNGNSNLLVTPAWRVPRERPTMTPARAFVRERLAQEYGLELGRMWELGGRYHPSPGVTPEVVYPLAVEVTAESAAARKLLWVPLDELIAARRELCDGHLRIGLLRAAHALGRLPQ